MTSAVLGVLDWGIGGMGVVQRLRERGVQSPVIYLSDTAAVPYGRLPTSTLLRRVSTAASFLQRRGATHLVIACNAASTVLPRATWELPAVGMIESTLRALRMLPPQHIGVIGGGRTIRSGLLRRGLQEFGHRVVQRVAQPLSGHIERGSMESDVARSDLARIVTPLRGVDQLVLACTHYPAITHHLHTELPGVRLFDPSHAVAQAVSESFPVDAGDSETVALCTGDPVAMRKAAIRTWNFDPGRCSRADLG